MRGVRGVGGPCCDIITTYAPPKKKILVIKTTKQKKKNLQWITGKNFNKNKLGIRIIKMKNKWGKKSEIKQKISG